MSTLNVANISDDQSTLSNSANPSDVLNNTTTVDTKYVTNGCAKCYAKYDGASVLVSNSTLNVSSAIDGPTVGMSEVSLTNAMSSTAFIIEATCNGTSGARFVTVQTPPSSSQFNTYTWEAGSSNGAVRIELPVGATVFGELA